MKILNPEAPLAIDRATIFTPDQAAVLKRISQFGNKKFGLWTVYEFTSMNCGITSIPSGLEFEESRLAHIAADAAGLAIALSVGATHSHDRKIEDTELSVNYYTIPADVVELATTHRALTVGHELTILFYTDIEPYEVISVSKSGKSAKIRKMKSTRLDDPVTIVGGFAGHTVNNNAIRYDIESDIEGQVQTIRLCKDGWKGTSNKVSLNGAHKHYDYNF